LITCHECGDSGHIARECPNLTHVSEGRASWPPWCGECDEKNRWLDMSDRVRRCPRCHPLRGRDLKQHHICGNCKQRIYTWDQAPCSDHQPLAVTAHGHRAVTIYQPGEQDISRPALRVACPWCKSGAGQQCINVGTGLTCLPHAARLELAGEDVSIAARLRELAAAQVAESRASRSVI